MTSGLIPLLLPTGGNHSRPGSAGSTPTSEDHRVSLPPFPLAPSLSLPALPSPGQHRRQFSLPTQRPTRRPSFTMPSSLTTRQPQTPTEWRGAVAEIKRKYVSRKYRACWTRCLELLDGLEKQQQQQERELEKVKEGGEEADGKRGAAATTPAEAEHSESPLVVYRIYLHFYAATSFEMGARPLSTSSPFRGQLLRDARSHYDRAAALIEATEEAAAVATTAAQGTRSRSRSRSRSGSGSASTLALLTNSKLSSSSPTCISLSTTFLNSPSLVSSRCSSRASVVSSSASSASAPSSPRTSLCSSLDGAESLAKSGSAATPTQNQPQQQQKTAAKPTLKKKKVSFSGLPELAAADLCNEKTATAATEASSTSQAADPMVRPDSPTLGFWDQDIVNTRRRKQGASLSSPSPSPSTSPEPAGRRLLQQHDAKSSTAEERRPPKPALSRLTTTTSPMKAARDGSNPPSPHHLSTSPSSSSVAAAASSSFDLEAFLQARSLSRVCAQLSGLRSQIRWHRDAVDALLDVPDETPETPSVSAAPLTTTAPATATTTTKKMALTITTSVRDSIMTIPDFPDVPPSSAFSRRGSEASISLAPSAAAPAAIGYSVGGGDGDDGSRSSSRSNSISGSSDTETGGASVRDTTADSFPPSSAAAAGIKTAAVAGRDDTPTNPHYYGRRFAAHSSKGSMSAGPYASHFRTDSQLYGRRGSSSSSGTSGSPTPTGTTSSSCSFHAYPFAYPARPGTSLALSSSPITPATGSPITPSSSSSSSSYYYYNNYYYNNPPSPRKGSAAASAHSHSHSYSQRPGSALGAIGAGAGASIGRPASAASVRSNGSVRDEGLQQRIERLRASGWQRKRFDTRRYETLREQVMGELGGGGGGVLS